MSIEFCGVTKRFGDKVVLDRFNVRLPEKGTVAVTGPSGAGKTTFINLLMGLIRPDEGRIEGLNGVSFTAVFQEDRLFDAMSVGKNIRLVCPGRVADDEIIRHLDAVGLAGELNSRTGDLSGGMKRRVALVRAVMARGDALVLDEPFKGVDDAMKARCAEYVLTRAPDRLIVLVTHDLAEAALLKASDVIAIG